MQLTIGDCPRHRFDQQPRGLGARPPGRAEVEALEEVEHLQQGQAPRRRPRRHDLQAAIRAADRLGDVDLVRLEVLPGDEPAVGGEVRGDGVGDLAVVEDVRSLRGQPFQGPPQVRLHHRLADRVQRPVVRIERLRRGRRLDASRVRDHVGSVVRRPESVHVARDREAVARERDRGLDRLLPRDAAEPGQRLVQAGDGARDADRLVPDVVDPAVEHVSVTVRRFANEDRLPLVLAHERTGGAVELEQRIAALGAVDEHHAASADAAHLRIDDALHEGARDGGVDRIAPAPHHLEPDLGRHRLRADDDRHARKLIEFSPPEIRLLGRERTRAFPTPARTPRPHSF